MEFLKRLKKSLLGSFLSSNPAPKRKTKSKKVTAAKKKVTAAPKKKRTVTAKVKPARAKAHAKKRPVAAKVKPKPAKPSPKPIGVITHFFPNVNAGVLKITKGTVKRGDWLHFKGATTDFKQRMDSLQIDRAPVEVGKVGEEIGIGVKQRVRAGDEVFAVES